ncbi:Hsp20/alpha crystallin family protein [Fontisphaera persica]|jgi:HSP20 family protein|uniref:Hsp20/alpha crystallin family protein n=1 Tax=Fontisphaera persica TaxID=2974023 RepID=UPI0024C02D68|nr:Hsp20/alpha crystallin family protein [Fontisphaera persica]WCJ60099.1 Hsp20/alpha crystallin family protein [Fontisphaera persica]
MSSHAIEKKEAAAPAPVTREQELWMAPNVDIYETKEAYTILAEMPGVNKAGLEVTVEDNELVITGRRDLTPFKGETLHRETRPAHYRRVFELDPAIDTNRISARMEQGVLTLVLPKAEKAKPRRVVVEG